MANTRARAKQVTFKSDATGGAVRNLHDKLSETVSVKDFGAIGDGVTDDTAAFNAAIATGNKVFVPSGTYAVSNITCLGGMHIQGEKINGSSVSTLVVNTNNASAFAHTGSGTLFNICIEDLEIQAGSGITGAKAFNKANKDEYVAYAVFRGIETHLNLEVSYSGFFIFTDWILCRDGYEGATVGGQTHRAIESIPDAYGQANQTNINRIDRCYFFNGSNTGGIVRLGYGADWEINGCDFEGGSAPAIRVSGVFNINVTNCWFEGLDTSIIIELLDSPAPNSQGCRGFSASNCHVYCHANNTKFISTPRAVSIKNIMLANVPAAMVLQDFSELNELTDVEVISGSPTNFFGSNKQVLKRTTYRSGDIESTVVPSPNWQGQNVLAIGPTNLGHINFTNNSFTAKADVTSGIGLAGNAVELTLAAGNSAAYYSLNSKLVTFLRNKTVTLVITGYFNTTSGGDFIRAGIWEDVVTPGNLNTTATGGTVASTSSALSTIYVTSTVGSSASTFDVGVHVGGGASGAKFQIESMQLLLGEHTPTLASFS